MEVIVKKTFRRRHPDGREDIQRPGDRIELKNSEKAHQLFDMGFIEIPMTEGRRRSLEMCMDATMFMAMKDVQEIGRWVTTMEVEEIEEEVHRTYLDVMKGLRKLEDYRKAVDRWKEAGTSPGSDRFPLNKETGKTGTKPERKPE